jgi:hypothetical protein
VDLPDVFFWSTSRKAIKVRKKHVILLMNLMGCSVKNHPSINQGHKTQYWCCQDEARRKRLNQVINPMSKTMTMLKWRGLAAKAVLLSHAVKLQTFLHQENPKLT